MLPRLDETTVHPSSAAVSLNGVSPVGVFDELGFATDCGVSNIISAVSSPSSELSSASSFRAWVEGIQPEEC